MVALVPLRQCHPLIGHSELRILNVNLIGIQDSVGGIRTLVLLNEESD